MLSKFFNNNKHFNFFILIWILILSIILIKKKNNKENFVDPVYSEYLEKINDLSDFLTSVKNGSEIDGSINLTGKLKINGQNFDTILDNL